MSDNEKTTKYGKFIYVEPNDILTEKVGFEPYSRNLTHPYEDYSMSVDLIVNKSNRFGVTINNNETHIGVGVNSSKNESISFLSGTDGFLTDNPGSIIYRDIMNKDIDGCKESLGINSINITYNSYFYPEVTINFTDIRGEALMIPQEENYRRSYMKNKEYVESFFSALFSFPYPEFILRVKGFYGKKIEYKLIVSDFKSSFNNQTGNFECIVKFIGRMYGMYTDIPMIYLIIAPFCKYGSQNGNTMWQRKNFMLDESTKMPTLIELKERMMTVNEQLKSTVDNDMIYNYKTYEDAKNRLNEIKNIYENLKKTLINLDDNRIFVGEHDHGHTFIFKWYNYTYEKNDSGPINIKEGCGYLCNDINIYKITTLIKELNTKTRLYNLTYNNYQIEPFIPYDEYGRVFVKKEHLTSVQDSSKIGKYYYYSSIYEGTYGGRYILSDAKGWRKNTTNGFIEKIRYDGKNLCFARDEDDFLPKLKARIAYFQTEHEKIDNELNNEVNKKLIELLGFKPSIRNVLKIIMAHLECFIEIYYDFTKKIDGRILNNFINKNDCTDIRFNGEEDIPFPAFPYFKKKGEKNGGYEYCYPTEVTNITPEECVLIDSLLNGVFDFIEVNNNITVGDYNTKMLPAMISDFLRDYNDDNVNPYTDVQKESGGISSKAIEIMMTYFTIRWFQNFVWGYVSRDDIDSCYDYFGQYEAYNFWVKNKDIDDDFINYLKNGAITNIFISYICNISNNLKNTPFASVKFYQDLTEKKSFVNNNDDLISSLDYFPGILQNWDDFRTNANKYKNSSDKDKCDDICFINDKTKDTCRPYGLIRLIDESEFNNWKNIFDNNQLGSYSNYFITGDPINDVNFLWFGEDNNNNKGEEYEELDSLKEILNVKSLKDNYEKYDNDLLSYHYLDRNTDIIKSVFLNKDFTPEYFLNPKLYNFNGIVKTLRIGNSYIIFPYALQLFLGMVLDKMEYYRSYYKKDDAIDSFEKWFSKIIDFYYYENDDYYKTIYHDIINLLLMLTRDKTYKQKPYGQEPASNVAHVSKETLYECLYESENDILGLRKKYTDWVESSNEMGFKFFKDKFYLKLNNNNNKNNVYETIKKCTDFDSLNESIVSYGDNSTAFYDIYSNVYFNDDKKNIFLIFNKNYRYYQDLHNFFRLSSILIFPYEGHVLKEGVISTGKRANVTGEEDKIKESFSSFITTLNKLYENNQKSGVAYNISMVNNENKLSVYKTLKNLQDKFLYNIDTTIGDYRMIDDNGNIKSKTELGRFHFLDQFYNDIGDDLVCNLESLTNLITNICDGTTVYQDKFKYTDMSVYSFISNVCQQNNLLLLTVPSADMFDKSNVNTFMENMFTPLSYNNGEKEISGSSYVCFYPSQPSQFLDNPSSQYQNDGFNIKDEPDDINNTADFTGPTSFESLSDSDEYAIPAFGVEYGVQKQSIFKNISISMDNPQTTEVAVANQFRLASENNSDVRNVVFEGQDLYRIYSNYSYECGVEMMGCAQIMPLMYFQLTNIPMFRGAYMIYHVEHSLRPGDMTTVFKGVRINRAKMPLTETNISIKKIVGELLEGNREGERDVSKVQEALVKPVEEETKDVEKNEETPKENASTENTENSVEDKPVEPANPEATVVKEMSADCANLTAEFLENESESNVRVKFEVYNPNSNQNNVPKNFEMLNPYLKNLIYSIAKDVYANEDYGKMTLYISSTYRNVSGTGNTSSDHCINNDGSKNIYYGIRSRVKDDCSGLNYNQLGCAVDMYIRTGGAAKKGEESIWLFKNIVNKYYDHISKLIWEVRKDQNTESNTIGNVIHLSSYGYKNFSGNAPMIYVAQDSSGKGSYKTIGYKKLPSEFLKIAKDIVNNHKDYYYLNNFYDFNGGKQSNVTDIEIENLMKEKQV